MFTNPYWLSELINCVCWLYLSIYWQFWRTVVAHSLSSRMIKLYLNAFNASSYYWWYLQTVYINVTDDLYLLIVHIGCTHCLYLRTNYYLYSQKSTFGLYLLTVIGNCWLHLLYEPSYWLYFLTILTTYQFYSLTVIAECKNCLFMVAEYALTVFIYWL